MTKVELDNALKQAVGKELQNAVFPCLHSSKDVWGQYAIVNYFEDDAYRELRGKLETYSVRLPVDENTDLKTVARCFVSQAEEIEQEAYKQALLKWSLTYPVEVLRWSMICHELCGWRFIVDDYEGIIRNGKATLVHYAVYLPDPKKVEEFLQTKERTDDNPRVRR